MKKILIINTNIFDRNGMSTVVMNYYEYMDRSNLSFDFIVNDYMDEDYKNYISRHGDNVYLFKNRKKNPMQYILQIKNIIKRNDYDVIHIHGNSSTVCAEIFAIKTSNIRAKVILHAHGVRTDHPFIHKIFLKYINRNIDVALAASEKAGEFLFKDFNEFTVIPNGIDVNKFKFNSEDRKRIRNKYSFNEKDKVLLHVGAFNGAKNQSFLIEMFNELLKIDNSYRLILIGDGELKNKKVSQVKKLNLDKRIKFLGEISDISPYYSASDVFLFPSNYEAFGIVALEAQANGLPCLVSDRLPTVVKLTNNLQFLKIGENQINTWIEFILKSKRDDNVDYKAWSENGYEISTVAEKIRRIYLDGK